MEGLIIMKIDLSKSTDDEITKVFQKSVEDAIQRKKDKGLPVCQFDMEKRKSYILYPDGKKVYA